MSKKADAISGGGFLIGLGALFLFDWFWPGIFLLLGIVALAGEAMKGKVWNGLVALLILGGLAAAFSFNWDWSIILPIALIGLGVLALLNSLRGR